MRYSDDIIEEVRMKNDIVDVISQYVKLTRKGSSYFGLCPFHNEKTPSFSVTPSKQMYYCFGCGAGGNVYNFIMEYENYSFGEALSHLADRAGVELPKIEYSREAREKAEQRAALLEINKLAAQYFYYQLRREGGKTAYGYLTGRGLSEETIRKFGLGYSDKYSDDLYKYLKGKGYSDELLRESGLFNVDERRGMYDKFWNRVIFPIMDVNNRVIGFGGRVMGDGKPKYLNSPETMIFDKSRNLFGLNFVHGKQDHGMIVCEGYMDVIALHQAGFTNAVASLGTAFTSQQSSLLKRYTDTVYLCYDSDGAGVKAALRAIPMLKEAGITVKVINMRPYKDPDEFIKALSKEEFQKRIDQAQNSFFYEIDRLRTAYNMEDPEEKTRFMNEAAKKCLTFDNEIERNNYIEAFARQYAIRAEDFRGLVSRQAAARVGIDYEKIRQERRQKSKTQKEDGILKIQGVLLTWIAEDVGLFPKISRWLQPDDFFEEPYHTIAGMLYEQARTGEISPAQIISYFESKEEQSLAAGIFNKQVQQVNEDSEREKALNEMVKTLKKASLDKKSREITDLSQLQKIIMEKKQLETLHITLT